MTRKINIFDTTLRDGGAVPRRFHEHGGEARHRTGAAPHARGRHRAGFPISSPGDALPVQIGRPQVTTL